jgi:hypothetical protein
VHDRSGKYKVKQLDRQARRNIHLRTREDNSESHDEYMHQKKWASGKTGRFAQPAAVMKNI